MVKRKKTLNWNFAHFVLGFPDAPSARKGKILGIGVTAAEIPDKVLMTSDRVIGLVNKKFLSEKYLANLKPMKGISAFKKENALNALSGLFWFMPKQIERVCEIAELLWFGIDNVECYFPKVESPCMFVFKSADVEWAIVVAPALARKVPLKKDAVYNLDRDVL